jgi:RinA family phage transcriptional activator
MKQIERSNFKMIEAELYCYKESKRELNLIREQIIEGSSYQEVAVQSGTTGDTTGNKGIKLATSRELLEVEKRINAIDSSLEILKVDRDKLKLLEMKYFERRFTDIGIQNELCISARTFYRWRREIVQLVGSQLGWRV